MAILVTCPVCEGEWLSGRSDRKYCSSACRQTAYRKRRRGDRPPEKWKRVKLGRKMVDSATAFEDGVAVVVAQVELGQDVLINYDTSGITAEQAFRMRKKLARARRALASIESLIGDIPPPPPTEETVPSFWEYLQGKTVTLSDPITSP